MSLSAITAREIYKAAASTDRHDMRTGNFECFRLRVNLLVNVVQFKNLFVRIEDLFYTGILRQKAKMNSPKALDESKWNLGREKETMCIHKGGINYDGIIRQVFQISK